MDGIATHDHGRVLRVGQEGYCSGIRNGVNPAQLNVDLKAHIGEILWFSLLALVALQALRRHSSLKGGVVN